MQGVVDLPEAVQSALDAIKRLCSAPVSASDRGKFVDSKQNREAITRYVCQFTVERYYFEANQKKEVLNSTETALLYVELKSLVEFIINDFIMKANEIPVPVLNYVDERVKRASHAAILGSAEIIAKSIGDPLPSHLTLRDCLYSTSVKQSLRKLGCDAMSIEGVFEDHFISSPYKMMKLCREHEYQINDATTVSRNQIKAKYPKLDTQLEPIIRGAGAQADKRKNERSRDACRTDEDWKTFYTTCSIPIDELPRCVDKTLKTKFGDSLGPLDLKMVATHVLPLFPSDENCPNSALVRFKAAIRAAVSAHFTQIDERSSIASIRPYVRVTKSKGQSDMCKAVEELKIAVLSVPVGTAIDNNLLQAVENLKSQVADYGGRTARALFSNLELAKFIATSTDITTLVSRCEQRWPTGVRLDSSFGQILRDFITGRVTQFDSNQVSAYHNGNTRDQKLAAYNGMTAHHATRRIFSHIDARLNSYAAELEEMGVQDQAAVHGNGGAGQQQPVQPIQNVADAQQNLANVEQNGEEDDDDVVEVEENENAA